ncbi:hypothetical protein WHZ78_07520 [Bradyrhizobium symbiodeficiens]|uniref:hypothetical protein n=1 Tax=Bradyrhizobium symbiodeficiens TaxID=1404367 RepID=UPI0030D538AE
MIITPNYFAYAALVLWPLVAIYLFATRPLNQALIWTILGGYLLLPVGTEIKIPGVPAFDKNSIPALIAVVGCLFIARGPARSGAARIGLPELLLAALLIGPFITSEFNSDTLVFGPLVLPGVGHYEALSASVAQLLVLLPFLLGRRYLAGFEDHRMILGALALAGLVYTLPMLLEVRLSPQLHVWTYGYFPHSFEQQMRDGGFRPVVFLGHGLKVAFFAMIAILASAALWRCRERVVPAPPALVTGWLGLTLLLCKSLGSFVYAMVLTPVILFLKPRTQVKIATVLVSLALIYPMLRATNLLPTQFLLDAAGAVSVEREASLKVRFDQEKALLDRASERPWFGWGRFGRGRIYDQTGKDVTLSDGHWVITMGSFGLFGFLAEFGLLALTVFRAIPAIRRASSTRDQVFLAVLSLIVAVGLVDLLPNATINPTSWLFAGALLGRAEALRFAQSRQPAASRPPRSKAGRFEPRPTRGSVVNVK